MPDIHGELQRARREEIPPLIHHVFTIRTTQRLPDGVTKEEAHRLGWLKIEEALRAAGIYAVENKEE